MFNTNGRRPGSWVCCPATAPRDSFLFFLECIGKKGCSHGVGSGVVALYVKDSVVYLFSFIKFNILPFTSFLNLLTLQLMTCCWLGHYSFLPGVSIPGLFSCVSVSVVYVYNACDLILPHSQSQCRPLQLESCRPKRSHVMHLAGPIARFCWQRDFSRCQLRSEDFLY